MRAFYAIKVIFFSSLLTCFFTFKNSHDCFILLCFGFHFVISLILDLKEVHVVCYGTCDMICL